MGWAAQYDATYASAKLGDVEGDEQAEMESGGFEIGEHVGHMDGSERSPSSSMAQPQRCRAWGWGRAVVLV